MCLPFLCIFCYLLNNIQYSCNMIAHIIIIISLINDYLSYQSSMVVWPFINIGRSQSLRVISCTFSLVLLLIRLYIGNIESLNWFNSDCGGIGTIKFSEFLDLHSSKWNHRFELRNYLQIVLNIMLSSFVRYYQMVYNK